MPQTLIAQAAQLACDDIFEPITPSVFGKIYQVGDTTCGTVLIDGVLYIVCQGAEATATSSAVVGTAASAVDSQAFDHPDLGPLHQGFYQNLPALMDRLMPYIPAGIPIVVSGHSKGAGEAAILGPLLYLEGLNVIKLVLFACPHVGHQQLADWIKSSIPGVSYGNVRREVLADGEQSLYRAPLAVTHLDVPSAGTKDEIGLESGSHLGKVYLAVMNGLGAGPYRLLS